jgi:prevent-host-death family protein
LVKLDQRGLPLGKVVYNLYEAKTALSHLVERAASGEEIVIAKSGKPMAKLVPARGPGARRRPGGWEGRVRIARDFDAPLPKALRDAFAGRS